MRVAVKYAAIGASVSLFVGWLALLYSEEFALAGGVWGLLILPLGGLVWLWPGLGAAAGQTEHGLRFIAFVSIYLLLLGSIVGGLLAAFQAKVKGHH